MRIKKVSIVGVILMFAVSVILCFTVAVNSVSAKAESYEGQNCQVTESSGDESSIHPYGMFVNLKLSLNGVGKGYVSASVKNAFTLFPATVRVVVELYSSDIYQESHTAMTLVCSYMTEDLNIGETIEARSSTNGVQKYWKGRMYYKVDSKDWEEAVTETLLYDGNGIFKM